MPAMKSNAALRDGPKGNKSENTAQDGDRVTVIETKDGWSHVKLDNGDEGWVDSTLIDGADDGPAAAPIDRKKFANSCVIQALISGVNPHYLLGVAQLRSGITAGLDGARIGPYRFTAEEWKAVVPPFGDDDISNNNQQIAGFALMVEKQMAAGGTPTPLQLYKAQWPDAPADIEAKLTDALNLTADLEVDAEGQVLDAPADPDADPPASSGQFSGTASGLLISERAYDLIISFEVSSEAVYNKRYRHPEWPGGRSGVTVGIGYDVGYASAAQITNDWTGQIDAAMIQSLQDVRGLKGQEAQNALGRVRNVDVPWASAINVHQKTVIPRWVGIVTHALPNHDKLSADSLGALVSLTYNRGASYAAAGNRYEEMRAIKQCMETENFAGIPGQIRAMKRLWPNVQGLLIRRDREADLFKAGLG